MTTLSLLWFAELGWSRGAASAGTGNDSSLKCLVFYKHFGLSCDLEACVKEDQEISGQGKELQKERDSNSNISIHTSVKPEDPSSQFGATQKNIDSRLSLPATSLVIEPVRAVISSSA